MRRTRHRAALRRGFTLVEAIASIVVLSILGSVVSGLILRAADAHAGSAVRARLHTEASVALDRLVREVRRIDPDPDLPDDECGADIDSITRTSLAWAGDSEVRLDGSNLVLSIAGEGEGVLAASVSAFEVHAYDESDSELGASLSGDSVHPVRRIRLSITLSASGVDETLEAKVFLRGTMSQTGGAG